MSKYFTFPAFKKAIVAFAILAVVNAWMLGSAMLAVEYGIWILIPGAGVPFFFLVWVFTSRFSSKP